MADINETKYFENGLIRGSFRAMIDVLLLRTEVYKEINEAPIPSRRGFGALLVFLVTASLAVMIGTALNSASMSDTIAMEEPLYEAITGLTIYTDAVASNPDLAGQFETIYTLLWTFGLWLGGYRSPAGILVTGITFITSNLFVWLTYGFLGFYVAKLFGAKVEKMGDYLGLMGLAFAPVILYAVEIVPGLVLPATLVTLWFVATSYRAIKSTYDLSWWRTVLVVFLPVPLNTILLTVTVVLGVFIGVAVTKLIS